MVRVPNSETPDQQAKRFLRDFNRQVADIKRRRVYRWTTHPDEISPDCITVVIGGADAEMISADLSYTEPTASIYWGTMIGLREIHEAGGVLGPFAVPDALARADQISTNYGYAGVVIRLQECGIWRDEWGTLADAEGLG